MTNEDGRWDPATVLGLRNTDDVLVVGNAALLPWLTTFFQDKPDRLVSVKRLGDVEAYIRDGQVFDRLIIAKETGWSNDHVLRAAALKAQLVVFPKDDGWQVENAVEFYYPGANCWRLETTYGYVTVAEPHGASWRIIHG